VPRVHEGAGECWQAIGCTNCETTYAHSDRADMYTELLNICQELEKTAKAEEG
jgi:hypothetical protein